MAYRICKTFEIEHGHMLSKHPDKCRFPHGHSRRVEFVLEADELDANGMVCDFKILRDIMEGFLDGWDHSLAMNTEDPRFGMMREAYGDRIIAFEGVDPTTEVMARTLFDVCSKGLGTYLRRKDLPYPLRRAVRLISVRLWETSSSWAEYRG
ncbi:MAG TPA: 6-carboxytetrahydropterin synthase [Verrucomicrobiae bacterium]|nr:6-carboxytetrahydropterin synthase [Verrucomicrobiae bacterium]